MNDAETREQIAKSIAVVDQNRRKRGRPRKPPVETRKVIATSSFTGVRRLIERMIDNHKKGVDLLAALRANNNNESPRETYSTACDLAAVGQRLHHDDVELKCWCDNIAFQFYYPSEGSWKEAHHAISKLRAASYYLSTPYPDTISMTNPGAMAIDALEAIQRFANK